MFSLSKILSPNKKKKTAADDDDDVMTSPISSVQTIGKGQIEADHQSIFSFQTFGVTNGWATTKHRSTITDELSSSEDEEIVDTTTTSTSNIKIDTTTDLAYHSKEEYVKCQEILQNLSPDEIQRLPDPLMPLRHYRAEKVGNDLMYCC